MLNGIKIHKVVLVPLTVVSINDSIVTASYSSWAVPILNGEIIFAKYEEQEWGPLGTVASIDSTIAQLTVDNKHPIYRTLIPQKIVTSQVCL